MSVLPAMGYAVLAIDHWCFGERNRNSERAMAKRLLWEGKTLWGYRVHDSLTALDWALAQPGWPICPSPRSGSRWAARWLSGAPRSMNASRSASICAASLNMKRCSPTVTLICTENISSCRDCVPNSRLQRSKRADRSASTPVVLRSRRPLTPPTGARMIDESMQQAYAALKALEGGARLHLTAGTRRQRRCAPTC